MSLCIWHRRDQSQHEDESHFGNPQPAFYPSVGGLHGQQTNTQVRMQHSIFFLCLVLALIHILRTNHICYIAPHLTISTPFSNMYQVRQRWSSCCVDAVPSFTWGWSASWQTFHLAKWQPSICLVLYTHTSFLIIVLDENRRCQHYK